VKNLAEENGMEWNENMVQLLGVDDETSARMHALYDAQTIEWHCRRHGVIRDVPNGQAGEVDRMLEWFYGRRCARWTKSSKGKRSVEFVPMTKVFPPPDKPWGWCGETVLFGDWQRAELDRKAAVREFAQGDRVSFRWKSKTMTGVVTHRNGKTVGVTDDAGGRWRMTPDRLTRSS
jgi:hypothetical protein